MTIDDMIQNLVNVQFEMNDRYKALNHRWIDECWHIIEDVVEELQLLSGKDKVYYFDRVESLRDRYMSPVEEASHDGT